MIALTFLTLLTCYASQTQAYSYNATGSYRVSMQIEEFTTEDWTLSTGVADVTTPENQNNSVAIQDIWLNAPNRTQICSNDLRYDICATTLGGFAPGVYQKAQQDFGDCSHMLSPDCISALLRQSQSWAMTGQYYSTAKDRCEQTKNLARPLACTGEGTVDWAVQDSFILAAKDTNNSCSNDTHPASWNHTIRGSAAQSSGYDELITSVTPVLLTAYPHSPNVSGWGGSSNIICVRARDVAGGSRKPLSVPGEAMTNLPQQPLLVSLAIAASFLVFL